MNTTHANNPKTTTVSVHTGIPDPTEAGTFIAREIQKELHDEPADVVIIFASSKYDYSKVLTAIEQVAKPKLLIGCSSAGEFTNQTLSEGSISAIALHSDEMAFSIGVGENISTNAKQAAEDTVSAFKGMSNASYPYRSALVLADALAGYTDVLIEHMNQLTAGTYQLFGGGAGDDAQFSSTHVFVGTEVKTNAVVTLEILSKKPIGIGVRHGWVAGSEPMRVTESDGMKLVSLNAAPAIEVIKDYADATEQDLDLLNPIPFFLHNVIGIKTIQGYQLRVPLSINTDGSINCASDIPNGSIVCFMKTTAQSAAEAAQEATEDALRQLSGHAANSALVFDCVATRLRTGKDFNKELQAVGDSLPGINFVGCNTYGQVSRADGQFNGFHNCTAVVCIFPE